MDTASRRPSSSSSSSTAAAPAEPTPSLAVAALRERAGTSRWPWVLDVRREPAYAASPIRIAGALRCPPEAIGDAPDWIAAGAEVICACVHGHEVSRDAAARLRALGIAARVLEGGAEAWLDAGGATRRADARLVPPARGGSVWVTRARPKVDRVACPWLVLRFIDPRARFIYLPADDVLDFASRTGAIAYDVPGGAIGHDGERCSFDALLDAAGLEDAALRALATIVRGADTGRPDLAPQAAGLLAMSVGLSRLHADDDHRMLAAALPLYDALYAWCRDAGGGSAASAAGAAGARR